MTHLEADPATSDRPAQRQYVDAPPVTCVRELGARWQTILDGEFFDQRSVWLIWFDKVGRQIPVVVPVDGLPDKLDEQFLAGLRSICDATRDRGAESMAIALSRRGSAAVTTVDRWQLRALLEMAGSTGLDSWPVHLATVESIREVTSGDLA